MMKVWFVLLICLPACMGLHRLAVKEQLAAFEVSIESFRSSDKTHVYDFSAGLSRGDPAFKDQTSGDSKS